MISHYVSRRDRHSLDEDVKLYFALGNALMDAGIVCWDCKRHYDSVRPISAIRFFYAGRRVRAWGGPGKGTRTIDGGDVAPLPEGRLRHTAVRRVRLGAQRLQPRGLGGARDLHRQRPLRRRSHTQEAGTSLIEPGVPKAPVRLSWKTFTEAAEEAGISRLYGGIHIMDANTGGLKLGEEVGKRAWSEAKSYFNGA